MALAQTGVLAAMVVDRTLLLKNGREITLPIVPVDPRDIFRGEYVRLGYDISTCRRSCWSARRRRATRPSTSTLEKNPQGGWTPVQADRAPWPNETEPDRIVLKAPVALSPASQRQHARDATASRATSCPRARAGGSRTWRARRSMAARIAVDARGNAAIKGLIIDGVQQYEEPLF